MTLKELRLQKGLTQAKCAEYLGVPLRTYQNYEKDEEWGSTIKAAFMFNRLEKYGFVDEEHGILTVEQITEVCERVFEGLGIAYCYLFGSYAKGTPTENSDVDLLVATDLSGMIFYALIENLREELKKKVDLIIVKDLGFISEHIRGITKEQLQKDEVLLDSVMFRLIQVSENAARLTDGFKLRYKEFPWQAMRGMRNRIVHEYGDVDLTIVYDTATKDVSALYESLSKLI